MFGSEDPVQSVTMSKRELALYTNGLTLQLKLNAAQKEANTKEKEAIDKWKAEHYDTSESDRQDKLVKERYMAMFFS